ncbi:MAG: TSUP family transporter [Pseudomonadota bacterium]|nr:TSUP family transporter [Pseudomonadota bacterium]
MTAPIGIMAILAAAGFGAGFVDSIAGGGGLLTVPALFAAGIPPILALGTNKLQSSVGTAMATFRYHAAGLIDWTGLLPCIALTAVGAGLGAWLVQIIQVATLKLIVPVLMMAAIVYFLVSPRMTDADSHQRISLVGYAPVAGLIGFYDGFFGPGTGSFLTASLVALVGLGLSRATGHTKAINLASNIVAAAIFIAAGKVLWGIALIMGLANIAGAWIGSHFALRHGARLIRPLLVLVSVGLTIKILLDPANPLIKLVRL